MSKQKYTIDFLKEYCIEHNISYSTLVMDKWDGRSTIITGPCTTSMCNNTFTKVFRQLHIGCGPYCSSCTKKIQRDKTKKKNIETFGVENPMQSKEVREKGKRTNLEKRGVEYPSQCNEIKDKKKKTCIDRYGETTNLILKEVKDQIKETNTIRYGTVNPSQSEGVKTKMKKTNMIRYGVENPMQSEIIQAKCVITNQKRYGVNYALQLEETKGKIKKTCLTKYGVSYPMQNAIVAEKSNRCAYRIKDYKLPSGNIIKVQGYEPFALDILVNENIKEDDIITSRKEVPEIWYIMNNKKRRYYVDIFIRSLNKFIEVKSTWTYQKDIHKIEAVKTKVKECGYIFECWIFNYKKEIVNII